jgi:hypothetical protein
VASLRAQYVAQNFQNNNLNALNHFQLADLRMQALCEGHNPKSRST